MDYISLGKKIRACRMELNLTQEMLAEITGITASFIGQIERAERKLSLETMISIANTLNMGLDYLLSDSLSLKCQPANVKTAAIDLIQTLLDNLKEN